MTRRVTQALPRPGRPSPLASLVAASLLAGCAGVPPQQSHADRAAADACEHQADQTYLSQNRFLMSERSTVDTPFSSSGLPGVTSNGLPDRYGRDQQLASCLRENGQSVDNANGIAAPGAVAPSPAQP